MLVLPSLVEPPTLIPLSWPPLLPPSIRYIKAIFREYTDGTFTVLKGRSAGDEYLGLLGPLIRAQVGDTIQIVFKNQLKTA